MNRAISTMKTLQRGHAVDLTPFSSRAANGLLMLLTNLLTCSKCLVISVARTMSMMACRSDRYSFLGRETETDGESARGEFGRVQEGKMERDDSVVNSMERRVNSFSILTAVTAVMNGCFVYCPLRGLAHVSHSAWGFKSHYSSNVGNTHKWCTLVYLQFLQK